MDCALYLISNLDHIEMKKILSRIVSDILGDQVTEYKYNGYSGISCIFFSISIETNDISGIDFLREDYGMDIDTELRIQLYGKTFYEGLEVLFKAIGILMREIKGDMFFLENGTDQLFRKSGDILIINNDLDQYQKKYLTKKLIDLLCHPYIEKNLSNI
ncbi:hypothetical protein [Paenibacillus ihumii]|uniref:hypothetical protein n=1 Tax=Paenibacillus ihumii TaxID=687436 RepID=UPI0006D79564|nr:hypothetical protein [Paenibacillus ihumii]